MPQAAKTQNCNSVEQDPDDSALMMGGYRALALTLYYLGDFKFARQCAKTMMLGKGSPYHKYIIIKRL
jgi:hypothetical protein